MARVSVHYTAFGEMAVSVGGARQPLTRRRERGVLSVLLAAHGAPVAAERLLAEVWGDDAPARRSARSRSRSPGCVPSSSRSGRRARDPGWSAPPPATHWSPRSTTSTSGGSRRWPRRRWRQRRPRSGWPRARRRSRLWTSTPYADCDSPLVLAETSPARGAAADRRGASGPGADRPGSARRRPALTGRRWRHSTPTASGCGRCSRSRSTSARGRPTRSRRCARLREGLAEELGVDPSEEIQRLEQAVLRQDPALTAATPDAGAHTGTSGARAASAQLPGRAHRHGRPPTRPRRGGALLEEASSTGSMRFLLVAGEPGIGKSRLVTDLGAHAERRRVPGARRALPRGRLRPGAVAVARHRPQPRRPVRGPGRRSDPLLDPLLGGELTGRSQWRWHRPADVRRRRRAGAALRRRDSRCCWCSRTSTGPTPRRCSCSTTWPGQDSGRRSRSCLHPAYDRGHHRRRPWSTRWPRSRGQVPSGSGWTGSTPAPWATLLQSSVGEHDARLDAMVADRDRWQPVLRAAVRPAARGDSLTSSAWIRGRPPRARRHPRRPAAARRPAAGRGGDGADRGRRARSPHRPGPGLGARRARRSTAASTCWTSR